MAVGEARKQASKGNIISQVSWTDGTAQDIYYGLDHSFQYASNINCDDELHGIKLSTKGNFTESYSKCQLVSLGDKGVMALPVDVTEDSEKVLKRFQFNGLKDKNGNDRPEGPMSPDENHNPVSQWTERDSQAGTTYSYRYDTIAGVVFQDRFWYGSNRMQQSDPTKQPLGYITSVPITGSNDSAQSHGSAYQKIYLPYDHPESSDESIEDPTNKLLPMEGAITAILNYNNTRLVVASGTDLWVYYPELDDDSEHGTGYYGQSGRKKVLSYEAGVTIVGLTCTFEYLKVRAVDEGWNTKVYYYQGNNNLRNTFVYNLVDLTGVRVVRVYSINGIDYYVSSLDGTDGFVNLYKLVGTTPVQLFKQRAGLDRLDVNFKAPYFVGPVGIDAAYSMGKFYIADAYGLFQFTYKANSYDTGYMKWGLYNNKQVYGVCENQGFLYVSTSEGCYAMRVWDTGIDQYQSKGVLISREFEGREGGTVTKMLDEIRMNFELNPNIKLSDYASSAEPYGEIDVYVSPNNLWKSTSEFTKANNRWHVMHITKDSRGTRAEKSNTFNNLDSGESAFKFDWQTITYAIVITRGDEEKATPIVRQIDIKYHSKDKINNVYDIN